MASYTYMLLEIDIKVAAMIYNTIPYHSMNDLNSHQSRSRLGLAVAASSSYSSPEWAAAFIRMCSKEKISQESPCNFSSLLSFLSQLLQQEIVQRDHSSEVQLNIKALKKQLWKCHPIQQLCTYFTLLDAHAKISHSPQKTTLTRKNSKHNKTSPLNSIQQTTTMAPKDSSGGGGGGGSDSRFFTTQKKGEMHELSLELHSTDRTIKVDAVKKVIASMTVGKDVSSLFTDVLNCVQTGNIELKKLVYLYLINYAKSQPELTLLAVNTFVKDANDPNPLIRALAVRTMGCIRVDRITEYLCEPLSRALRDEDPVSYIFDNKL